MTRKVNRDFNRTRPQTREERSAKFEQEQAAAVKALDGWLAFGKEEALLHRREERKRAAAKVFE